MREHFRPTGNPVADPANVLTGDRYRITVLDDGLVRLEYDESGEFEDRASQTVVDRAFPPAEFDVIETDDRLKIHTERLQLVYDKGPFSTHGLSVQAKGGFHSERQRVALRAAHGQPRRHRPHPRRRRRRRPAGGRRALLQRRRAARRLAHRAAHRRRLDRAAPTRTPSTSTSSPTAATTAPRCARSTT